MKEHLKLYGLTAWMSIVPILSSIAISSLVINNEQVFSELGSAEWAMVFLISVLTMSLAITPTTFISLVTGYFLGFAALIPLVLAYQTASLIGYEISRRMDEGFLELILKKYPKSKNILENVESNQLALTILSRISPTLPFAIMNVVLAVSGIKLRNFLIGGLIGMLPRTIFFVWLGSSADFLIQAMGEEMNIYWTIGISVVILIIFYQLLTRIKTRQKI